MKARDLLALGAMLAVTAVPAAAQFTTVVAPPKREAPAADTRAEQAAADTGRRTALRDMSAWVDSVAGVPAATGTVVDSATGVIDTASTAPEAQASPTERFRDGARAPDTATALPALFLLGLALLGAGAALFATRARDRAPARQRAP